MGSQGRVGSLAPLPKLRVAGSNPVVRFRKLVTIAATWASSPFNGSLERA
jgi:hypothetical protein